MHNTPRPNNHCLFAQEARGGARPRRVWLEAEERQASGDPAVAQAARAASGDVQRSRATVATRLSHRAAAHRYAEPRHAAAQVPPDCLALPKEQDAHVRPPQSGQRHFVVGAKVRINSSKLFY